MTTPEKHPLEILAPDGPHETIIAVEEQAAPMADVAAFAEALKGFSQEDYCGDTPYDLLVRSSQYAWNQFDSNQPLVTCLKLYKGLSYSSSSLLTCHATACKYE